MIGVFSVMGRLVMGCLALGRLVMGHFVCLEKKRITNVRQKFIFYFVCPISI